MVVFMCLSFEVEATRFLTASVMSTPASLAIAKTFWPEMETPRFQPGPRESGMDARSEGRRPLNASNVAEDQDRSLLAGVQDQKPLEI
ncbi:solute carrier family 28 member 3-like [Micropterus dolomieu]|uniref:solute carrier family 28 member 3-like n=1 Tax=Micropterus dolomieu TaxID=147949 RepID=UPI001E8ED748|nr:solute carrier family 28 member 3-like [Micropterus dolomieu]